MFRFLVKKKKKNGCKPKSFVWDLVAKNANYVIKIQKLQYNNLYFD